jgi:outer membrane protein insertion porin family
VSGGGRSRLSFFRRRFRFRGSVAIYRNTLLGLLGALLLTAPPVRAADAVVKDVRIEGYRRVDPGAIRNAIGTKPGQKLDGEQVDADIRAIMKLPAVSDVAVEVEGSPSAPVVVYRITERPTVRDVRITGNEILGKDDLKEGFALKVGGVYDRAVAQKDVESLLKKYAEKGYFLAEITVKADVGADNQVDVVYQVNEHAKVQIKEIRIVGNDHVPMDDFTPYMHNKVGGLLPWSGGGTFREDALEADVGAVQAVYLEKGYVEVKVGRPAVQLSADRRYVFVTIPVVEGPQYDIGKVAFSGELLGRRADVEKLSKLTTGKRFVRSQVAGTLLAIQDLYRDMGYAYANVEPKTSPHPDTRRVDIDFEVQPGPQVRIGRIEFVGNVKTRDKVLRREMRVYEGELFSGTGLKQSKQRIMALGYFESADIAQTRRGPDVVDLRVTVKERPTGTFQFGVGYSSYENFTINGQISQQNFLGWGRSLTLNLQWSSIRQLGELSWEDPYFLDTRWTYSFSVYGNETSYSAFTRSAVGGSMSWGYELAGLGHWWKPAQKLEDVRLFATYTYERVSVATAGAVSLARASGSGSTSALRFTLTADKRDNRITPSSGWYASGSFETAPRLLAPKSLFGDRVNLFNRTSVDLRGYRPLGLGIVGRTRLNLGWLQALSSKGVPLSELYFLGGVNNVRGYRLNTIAPPGRQACNDSPYSEICRVNGEGYRQVILNVEAEFPLVEKANVRGVVFFDAGNAFAAGTYHDPRVSLSLYKSVGFGFRWLSPLGPLRFEWGIPLDRRKDDLGNYIDQPLDFQFTVGNFF